MKAALFKEPAGEVLGLCCRVEVRIRGADDAEKPSMVWLLPAGFPKAYDGLNMLEEEVRAGRNGLVADAIDRSWVPLLEVMSRNLLWARPYDSYLLGFEVVSKP